MVDIKEITPLQATGLYNELLPALRITSDHMKLMRNFLDPTEIEAILTTTDIANQLDNILLNISDFQEPIPIHDILDMVEATIVPLKNAIEFGEEVAQKAESCKVYVQSKPDDIRHMKRETDFFLGIFDSILEGRYTKDANTLGIPIPNQTMATSPRVMIDKLPIDDAAYIALTWAYFWSNQNIEHTALLRSLTHPEDTDLIENLDKYEKYWKDLFDLIIRDPRAMIPQIILNADNWNDFLEGLLQDIRTCKIRENFPQRLVEHMILENEMLTEANARFINNTQDTLLSPIPEQGAVYDQFPPRELMFS